MPRPRPTGTNNPLGTLSGAAAKRRDSIEEALVILCLILVDLDELIIRVDQAIGRTAIVGPVLQPAYELLMQTRIRLAALHADLSAYWRAGQSRRWM